MGDKDKRRTRNSEKTAKQNEEPGCSLSIIRNPLAPADGLKKFDEIVSLIANGDNFDTLQRMFKDAKKSDAQNDAKELKKLKDEKVTDGEIIQKLKQKLQDKKDEIGRQKVKTNDLAQRLRSAERKVDYCHRNHKQRYNSGPFQQRYDAVPTVNQMVPMGFLPLNYLAQVQQAPLMQPVAAPHVQMQPVASTSAYSQPPPLPRNVDGSAYYR